ncbi:ribosomal protein L32 [Desulfarculus baarsii DSM 2075]|uniref:Large ribosomal subunit protein bL32 n=1 Tax=Desulfarculus baarsii (strain ATCC 33931 / DSM 2075 / LMG 7858 / VKM B-1802 / 2st14) TaxID=644282 RepID=E1QJL2_DESB2|nr:50S ribosomal protein L32 [Desulfarculus baarsii]ADK85755.1 ribosomal protein L32 [Desulfarculus baarsii DSM 2075]
MAVPKKRQSTTRRDKRRAHDAITLPNTIPCPQCGEAKLPHRVCPSCGTYKGRQLLEPKE